uniref:PDZ domain-containing protein n=1 Tax=Macrostomum lignano TaxID=282301 RepID=A0A1I8IM30_9PLAT
LDKVTTFVTELNKVTTFVTELDKVTKFVTELDKVTKFVTESDKVTTFVTKLDKVTTFVTELDKVTTFVTELNKVTTFVTELDKVTKFVTELDKVTTFVTELDKVTTFVTELDKHSRMSAASSRHPRDGGGRRRQQSMLADDVNDVAGVSAVAAMGLLWHRRREVQRRRQSIMTMAAPLEVSSAAARRSSLVPKQSSLDESLAFDQQQRTSNKASLLALPVGAADPDGAADGDGVAAASRQQRRRSGGQPKRCRFETARLRRGTLPLRRGSGAAKQCIWLVFNFQSLNTEWTELEVIDLANDGSGLGFGIIGSKSTGVVVRTILPGGVADADGRLRSGDHLLYICPVNVRGMTSEQVATVLRQSGDRVRLVVARVVRDESEAAAAAASSDADTDGRCRQLVRLLNSTTDSTTWWRRWTRWTRPGKFDGIPNSARAMAQQAARVDSAFDRVVLMDSAGNEVEPFPPHSPPSSRSSATSSATSSVSEAGAGVEPPPIIEPAKMSAPPPPPPAAAEVETDYEEFFVELHRGSSGLGITIAGYVGETSTAKLNGIFIKEIADGSAADKDGRLRVNDRIVQVDSVSLDGYTNQEAVEILKRAGSAVQLKLLRYNRGPIYEQLQTNTAALSPAQYKTVVAQRVPDLDGENDPAEESDFSAPLSDADMAALQTRWRLELGDPDCEIVVAQFAKFSDSPGLGISLEGTVDVLENGDEARPHHYIREVVPDGPAGREGTLRRRDELLEARIHCFLSIFPPKSSQVNNRRVLGLNHLEVVEVLKSLPQQVCIVCARSTQPEIDEMDEYEDQAADEEVDSDSASASAVVVGGASGGKSRSVEDFSGMGVWSDQATEVELEKTARGLGFSVLDYQPGLAPPLLPSCALPWTVGLLAWPGPAFTAKLCIAIDSRIVSLAWPGPAFTAKLCIAIDPLCSDRTVIIVRSLVPGGLAHKDGRILPGDRLLYVNDVRLEQATLEEAVQCLKSAPEGRIVIGVAKPSPLAAASVDAAAALAAAVAKQQQQQQQQQKQQSCRYSTPQLGTIWNPAAAELLREQQRAALRSLLSRYAKDRTDHSLNVVAATTAASDASSSSPFSASSTPSSSSVDMLLDLERLPDCGSDTDALFNHRQPPATSSHARQASDLSQLTIDTGTSGDNVSLSSFDSHKTDGDDTATADTPEPRRCSLSDGKSDGDDADQEEAEDEEDEEELPPIPSALERTLKLRKSGFEELGLVIAAGGKGTNGCVVTEVLPGSAAARSGTLQPGDYVTAVNSESLRRLDEAKKFSANQPKQRLSRKSGDSEA